MLTEPNLHLLISPQISGKIEFIIKITLVFKSEIFIIFYSTEVIKTKRLVEFINVVLHFLYLRAFPFLSFSFISYLSDIMHA